MAKADALSVAVSANMQFVFEDLKASFELGSQHRLKGIANSSGKLVSQIRQGAPFDVFLSADSEYPALLVEQGIAKSPAKIYAYGAIVLWSMKSLDLTQWQSLLKNGQIGKIAIANPKTAPYGRETRKLLAHYGLEQAVANRVVLGESIAQTNQYIFSGAVDMGFTAKSVVMSKAMQGQGQWIDIPAAAYAPIAQGVVILAHAKAREKAVQEFVDFLFSPKAQIILRSYGYKIP